MRGQKSSPRVGRVTHPSGAPDNHLLTVWSPGPVNGGYTVHRPAVDGGIYLIKSGMTIDEPGQMLLIKNDPKYNEQWPRALTPYRRIYGIDEPKTLLPASPTTATRSPHLPAGTPLRPGRHVESVQARKLSERRCPRKGVTAVFAGGFDRTGYQDLDPFNSAEAGVSLNWFNQGRRRPLLE